MIDLISTFSSYTPFQIKPKHIMNKKILNQYKINNTHYDCGTTRFAKHKNIFRIYVQGIFVTVIGLSSANVIQFHW